MYTNTSGVITYSIIFTLCIQNISNGNHGCIGTNWRYVYIGLRMRKINFEGQYFRHNNNNTFNFLKFFFLKMSLSGTNVVYSCARKMGMVPVKFALGMPCIYTFFLKRAWERYQGFFLIMFIKSVYFCLLQLFLLCQTFQPHERQ